MADEPEQVDKSPYAYGWNNPIKYDDPDGKCPRCIKAAIKTTIKSIAKGKVDLGEFYDIAESVGTLVDGNLNMADAEAVFNLLSPVSTKELKAGKKLAEKALSKVDEVVEKAGEIVNKVDDILPKPPRGKGKVSPGERDPKRAYSKEERQEMLDGQGGVCASCKKSKSVDQVDGHHKERHADGGKTDKANGAAVCKDCHKKLHSKDD